MNVVRPDEKITPTTRIALFGMLSAMGWKDKPVRIAWAKAHGVEVDSFSKLTEEQGQYLCECIEAEGPPEV